MGDFQAAKTFKTGVSHRSGVNFVNPVLEGLGGGRAGGGCVWRFKGNVVQLDSSEVMAPWNAEQALPSEGRRCEGGRATSAAPGPPPPARGSHLGGTRLGAGVPGRSTGAQRKPSLSLILDFPLVWVSFFSFSFLFYCRLSLWPVVLWLARGVSLAGWVGRLAPRMIMCFPLLCRMGRARLISQNRDVEQFVVYMMYLFLLVFHVIF